MRSIPVASLALLLVAARPAAAQARIDFTPSVGVYFPAADLAEPPGTMFQDRPAVQQDVKSLFEARMAVWPGTRAGVELGVGYSASGVYNGISDVPGRVWLGELRLLYGAANGTKQCTAAEGGCIPAVYAAAGLGLIFRGGQAWKGVNGTSSLGVTVGVGYRLPAGPVVVHVEGGVLLYSTSFTQSGTTIFSQAGVTGSVPSRFQKDLLLSLQVGIPLAGGSR